MKNYFKIPVIVTLLLFGFLSVNAQELGKNFGIGLYGSPHKLVGGNADKSMVNFWGGLNLFYGFSDKLVLESHTGAGWSLYADPDNPLKRMPREPWKYFRTWLGIVDLNLNYYFKDEGTFRPYLTVGGGMLIWQLRYARWTDDLLSPSGFDMYGTQYNISGNTGLGFVLGLSDRFLLDFSGRYHYFYDQDLDNIGDGYDPIRIGSDPYGNVKNVRTGDANNGLLEFRIGLKFLFGGPKDADGDGIIDKLDRDPKNAEDFDGFQDEDGMPDPDNDNDGVLDELDQCPNIPEDVDGFEDLDGCPDPDNDGDGIEDKDDKCPDEPEDFDGFEDEDGCPDLDNDEDGIPDDKDMCPNKPETFNGFEDEDGCPDEVPVKKEPPMKKGVTLIFPEVTFETGSANLAVQAKLTLDNVYDMLWEYKEVTIEIRGYTDNTGSAAINQQLSRKRAQAVKQYLINKGIESNRMIAFGYGKDSPIAPNNTREGRAKNRRIEFIRIK
jgi:outer membrane protein OmpA-like peptidoglycan-associated protein